MPETRRSPCLPTAWRCGMKEITGNLWDYYGKPNHIVCITTNGMVKRNGKCVMGRGCAFEATQRVPGIASALGNRIQAIGNQNVFLDDYKIMTFPVKHHWKDAADLNLISDSAFMLTEV